METRKKLLEIKCPITITQNVISGKWKIVILFLLKDGPIRFNAIQKLIPQIRQGYLTQQLRELEQDGLVHREIYKVIPPKVEYSLTVIGVKFLPIFDKMSEWGKEYMAFIENKSISM